MIATSILGILFLCALMAQSSGMLLGGYQQVDAESDGIKQAASFAFKETFEGESEPFFFIPQSSTSDDFDLKILKAFQQVNAVHRCFSLYADSFLQHSL